MNFSMYSFVSILQVKKKTPADSLTFLSGRTLFCTWVVQEQKQINKYIPVNLTRVTKYCVTCLLSLNWIIFKRFSQSFLPVVCSLVFNFPSRLKRRRLFFPTVICPFHACVSWHKSYLMRSISGLMEKSEHSPVFWMF